MLRLLRRRQGILLAVFGTVLMILMLADQSIYGLMGRLFSGSAPISFFSTVISS